MSVLSDRKGGVVVVIYAQPRASKTALVGLHDGALKVRLAAPPVEGEANDELVRFFAKWAGVAKGAVELLRGDASRHKQLFISGVTAAQVREKLKLHGIEA